jgi:hypothetical protein
MKIIKRTIIGSGFSSFILSNIIKNAVVISERGKKILKNHRFYEKHGLGGNTQIWGGYINTTRLLKLKENHKFKKFIEKNPYFEIRNLTDEDKYSYCGILIRKNTKKIFRINKTDFNCKVIFKKILKFSINKKIIELEDKTNKIFVHNLNLCVGNGSLLKILYNSKFITDGDIISFDDGSCSYTFFFNKKKNYFYVPMSFCEIFEKLFKEKKTYFNKIYFPYVFQKFQKKKNYTLNIKEFFSKKLYMRYFLSNHITNLKINEIPIQTFVSNINKNIKVYNSGTLPEYISGPISQDLIYQIIKNEI